MRPVQPVSNGVEQSITRCCEEVKNLLLTKNREYGNSALEPLSIFSDMDAVSRLDVRIDDKLSRILTTRTLTDVKIHEDTELDLIGYLVLKRVYRNLYGGKV